MRLSAYRSVGDSDGDPYPLWLRNLRGESGVYVIRDRFNKEPLYVGESHSGRLYRTLTRHLQGWSSSDAWKQFPTYQRGNVEVAVVRTGNLGDLRETQQRLIRELDPIDNVYTYEVEEVPF